jgi:hypothetical protein
MAEHPQPRTVTDIDRAIRREIAALNEDITSDERTAALARMESLKQRRFGMVETRTYNRMLSALK